MNSFIYKYIKKIYRYFLQTDVLKGLVLIKIRHWVKIRDGGGQACDSSIREIPILIFPPKIDIIALFNFCSKRSRKSRKFILGVLPKSVWGEAFVIGGKGQNC